LELQNASIFIGEESHFYLTLSNYIVRPATLFSFLHVIFFSLILFLELAGCGMAFLPFVSNARQAGFDNENIFSFACYRHNCR